MGWSMQLRLAKPQTIRPCDTCYQFMTMFWHEMHQDHTRVAPATLGKARSAVPSGMLAGRSDYDIQALLKA